VSVPDKRLDLLAELVSPEKIIFSTIKFIDIAGIIEGASKGEGLGNRFLANIRETDLILFVLRSFDSEDIINTQSKVDPKEEATLLETELLLKDLETIDNRIRSATKEARAGDKELVFELEALQRAKKMIEDGLSLDNLNEKDRSALMPYRLLTMKPRIYLLNGSDRGVSFDKWPVISFDVANELDFSELDQGERDALGLGESKVDQLITKSYELLDLITFFTVGADEARAWKIRRGTLAPDAAGEIHTDFKKKFIKAEVINWKELLEVGGLSEARKKGLIRTEGKEYIFQDGDVVEIKHGA